MSLNAVEVPILFGFYYGNNTDTNIPFILIYMEENTMFIA
jgi:hypothetical protein